MKKGTSNKLSNYIPTTNFNKCRDCGEKLSKENFNESKRKTKGHKELCDICYNQLLYYDNKN